MTAYLTVTYTDPQGVEQVAQIALDRPQATAYTNAVQAADQGFPIELAVSFP